MDREQLPRLNERWIDELWNGDHEALFYLTGRGITPDMIERYHLGFTAEGVDGRFKRCVSIPYLTGTGALRGVRFRRLDGTPKYDAVKGEKAHLFNVGSVKHHRVYITEGEFDAIVLEQLGYPAVGVPGATNFKEEWKWLFIGNDVRIIFDGDDAGKKAARRIAHDLRRVTEGLEVIELPIGADVSDLHLDDPGQLIELIKNYED